MEPLTRTADTHIETVITRLVMVLLLATWGMVIVWTYTGDLCPTFC